MITVDAECPDCGDDGPHPVPSPEPLPNGDLEAECRACYILFPVLPESVDQMTIAEAEARIHLCDVVLAEGGGVCGDLPAYAYEAECAYGHGLDGFACEPCMAARVLGCEPCRLLGRGPVRLTFAPGTCHCGCGRETAVADRSDSRWGRVRGRPGRYVSAGHNPRPMGALGRQG